MADNNSDEQFDATRLRIIERRVAALTRLVWWTIGLQIVVLVCLLLPGVRQTLGGLTVALLIGAGVLLFIVAVIYLLEKALPTKPEQQGHSG